MSTLTVSRRYARALFDLSQEGVDLAGGLATLAEVSVLPEVQEFLAQPQWPNEAKMAVLEKSSGKLSGELSRFIALLCERSKTSLLAEINELFEEMVREAQAKVDATVVVASKPSKAMSAKIESAVENAAGKKVDLDIIVDEKILGGLVVKIGDRQIDCSVRGKLDGLRRALAA
ncbi:MAG: F0F1 ATP synthase subunit delta [Mariprofundaceae bacterium]